MTKSPSRVSAAIGTAGVGLSAVGLAHFAAPSAFDTVTRAAFPDDTRAWVYRNGTTETILGVALAVRPTRPIGLAGAAAYVGFLMYRASSARR